MGGTAAGLFINASASSGQNTSLAMGVYGVSGRSGTSLSSITKNIGVYGRAEDSQGNTNNYGVFGFANNSLAVSDLAINDGVAAQTGIHTTSSNKTQDSDFHALSPNILLSGILTHHYGLKIEDQTGGGSQNPDPWGIWEAVAGDKNQFGTSTFIGELTTLASATGGAGFNLPPGTAPTSPVNGDVWTTSAGMYARINGVTVGPFGTGGGGMVYPGGSGIPQVVSGTSWGTTYDASNQLPLSFVAGTPVDITAGTPCNGSADDTSVLQSNATAVGGGFAYIPSNRRCETTTTLTLPYNLQGFWIGPGSQLQATAVIASHAVVEIGDSTHRSTNPEIYGGGTIDANGKADYVFWAHNFAGIRVHDFTAKGSLVNGLYIGDSGSNSNNAWVHDMWIDRPGAVSIPSGSIGILTYASDASSIHDNTIISYDQGITANASNNTFVNNHVWARLTMTECFADNGTGNTWLNDYGDTCGTYGFRFGTTADNFHVIGGRVYNNSSGPDNTTVGIYIAKTTLASASISGVLFKGETSSNRLATDVQSLATAGFANIEYSGNLDVNVVTKNVLGLATAGPLTVGGSATIGGLLTTAASATGGAGFNLPQGTAPTSPNNGDAGRPARDCFAESRA